MKANCASLSVVALISSFRPFQLRLWPSACFLRTCQKNLEVLTNATYVAAIVPFHQMCNIEAPNIEHFTVHQALAGVKRQKVVHPDRKILYFWSISRSYMLSLLPEHCRLAFWSAYLVAFSSLLKRNNCFRPSAHHMRTSDWKTWLSSKAILFTYEWSKLQVFRSGNYTTTIKNTKSVRCLVSTVPALLRTPGMKEKSSPFSYGEAERLVPVEL